MKYLILSFAMLLSFSVRADVKAPLCNEQIHNDYLDAINYLSEGTKTRTDVDNKRLAWLKEQLDCSEIGKIQYCFEAFPIADELVKFSREERLSGTRSNEDVSAAVTQQFNLNKYCSSNL